MNTTHSGRSAILTDLKNQARTNVAACCQLAKMSRMTFARFINGTSPEHGLSVGMFRENSGRIWAGIVPQSH